MARNFRKPAVSMRGRVVDMDAMRSANEEMKALGNARMNARGDIMGRNGQIEVRREQIARDYYNRNPGAAQQVSLKPAVPDVFETPEQAMSRITGAAKPAPAYPENDEPDGLMSKKGRRLIKDSDD
jgi:hypothetical protein